MGVVGKVPLYSTYQFTDLQSQLMLGKIAWISTAKPAWISSADTSFPVAKCHSADIWILPNLID